MSLVEGVTLQSKLAAARAVAGPTDQVMIALYGANARLGPNTESYTPEGEVVGRGYVAGGIPLEGYEAGIDGDVAFVTWTEPAIWRRATIRAGGALIYNRSQGNRAISVLRFESEVSSTNGPLVVPMPPATAEDAIVTFA